MLARRVAPVLVSGAAAALGAVVALEGAAAARTRAGSVRGVSPYVIQRREPRGPHGVPGSADGRRAHDDTEDYVARALRAGADGFLVSSPTRSASSGPVPRALIRLTGPSSRCPRWSMR
ncbi:hypothetical protein [Streptomyces bullii]|uniref:Uncharacterized protein n=1 Tax=Streptomyces bullii TaxID=349910 RepID=A0ABW0UQ92_9ACTN